MFVTEPDCKEPRQVIQVADYQRCVGRLNRLRTGSHSALKLISSGTCLLLAANSQRKRHVDRGDVSTMRDMTNAKVFAPSVEQPWRQ
jgi:hypothetical protein